MTDPEIRELTAEDTAAAEQLSAEAFGRAPRPDATPLPGARYLGAFISGQLAAKVTVRDYDSHFHGTTVPTCGIGGVTVAAEHRGRGLVRQLLPRALDLARADGAVISGLFPTALGIYRPFGYEHITDLDELTFATADLAEASAPDLERVRVRRATEPDVAAVKDCYDRWGAGQNGPLTRRGVSFPATDAEILAAFTSVFLAETAAGEVEGYCLWRRGQGYGPTATIEVLDLVATTAAAGAALLRTIGSFAMVTGLVTVRGSGGDATRWIRRSGVHQVAQPTPYLLAVLDVSAALAALTPPPGLEFKQDLLIRGRAGQSDVPGRYRIGVSGGTVAAERIAGPDEASAVGATADELVMTPGGLASWWAGAAGLAELRMGGLVNGSDANDRTLDAIVSRRPVRILDHY